MRPESHNLHDPLLRIVLCTSCRRERSEQGVANPIYIGDLASNKSPIYEEIKDVYEDPRQPYLLKPTFNQDTADDDYDDVDRLSIKSDEIPVDKGSFKSSEPLPPPGRQKLPTKDSKAPMQHIAVSTRNDYASLDTFTSSESQPLTKQQEEATTQETEAPTQSLPGDTGNDYAALITSPTGGTSDYQELVAAPPVPPGYDVPSNIPATSQVTDLLDGNSKPSN